jgi:hypothetical protein
MRNHVSLPSIKGENLNRSNRRGWLGPFAIVAALLALAILTSPGRGAARLAKGKSSCHGTMSQLRRTVVLGCNFVDVHGPVRIVVVFGQSVRASGRLKCDYKQSPPVKLLLPGVFRRGIALTLGDTRGTLLRRLLRFSHRCRVSLNFRLAEPGRWKSQPQVQIFFRRQGKYVTV